MVPHTILILLTASVGLLRLQNRPATTCFTTIGCAASRSHACLYNTQCCAHRVVGWLILFTVSVNALRFAARALSLSVSVRKHLQATVRSEAYQNKTLRPLYLFAAVSRLLRSMSNSLDFLPFIFSLFFFLLRI